MNPSEEIICYVRQAPVNENSTQLKCNRPTNNEQQVSRPCICQSSEALTIEIDEITASTFTKGWDQSEKYRKFKIFPKQQKSEEKFLQIYKVEPENLPSQNTEQQFLSPELLLDGIVLEKHVKLIKVSQDGTFHYELDTSDIDEGHHNDKTYDNESMSSKNQSNELSKSISTTNRNNPQVDNKDFVHTNWSAEDNHVTSIIQNRPPVIMVNTGHISNNDTKASPPSSPIIIASLDDDSNIANNIEIDTCMDVDTDSQSMNEEDNVLQPLSNNANESKPNITSKQYAEVAPFRRSSGKTSKKSPRRSKALKSPVSAVKQDLLNEQIRCCSIKIGPGDTTITGETYHSINWLSVREATRKLLTALFPRQVLATHTLTGRPSPAFRDRQLPTKRQLNPEIVNDIISIVRRKCNADARTVRSVITLKCADENKMLKMRLAKECNKQQQNSKIKDEDKEN